MNNNLQYLSDKELQEYYQLYKTGMQKTKRFEAIKTKGHDTKYMYHVVRLLNECEQILIEGDLDLMRNREQLKSIRRGEWKQEQVVDYFTKKELLLEAAYQKSKLPYTAPIDKIKKLYLDCLEIYYGSLTNMVDRNKDIDGFITDIELILDKYKK